VPCVPSNDARHRSRMRCPYDPKVANRGIRRTRRELETSNVRILDLPVVVAQVAENEALLLQGTGHGVGEPSGAIERNHGTPVPSAAFHDSEQHVRTNHGHTFRIAMSGFIFRNRSAVTSAFAGRLLSAPGWPAHTHSATRSEWSGGSGRWNGPTTS